MRLVKPHFCAPSIPLSILFKDKTVVVLSDVSLTDGTITGMKQTLTAGRSKRVNVLTALKTQYPTLRQWSQLDLASATVRADYNQRTTAVINDRELVQADFGSTYNWHGVHQSRTAAGVPEDADGNPIFSSVMYSINDDETYLYVAALGGIWSGYTNPDASLSFGGDVAWLEGRTVAELETYFAANPYDATAAYVYFDPARPTAMRILTGAGNWTTGSSSSTWVELEAGDEYDEVASSEFTITATYLLSQGLFDIALASGAITEDKIGDFRLYTILTQN